MIAAVDETILKAHVSAVGDVWFADGHRSPVNSGCSTAAFMDHPVWHRRPRDVRVLGVSQNAALIVSLFDLARQGSIHRIELAGPLVCETNSERNNPEIALFRMRQCLLPSYLGGWHLMTAADYPVYLILSAIQDNKGVPDATAVRALHQHPVWPYLRFIRGVSQEACAKLIAMIVDPRWFVSANRPDRIARLENYLGLSPHTQRVVSAADATVINARQQRCAWVMAAWKTAEPPSASELQIPENFLWRDWRYCGGGAKGDLRASQRFVAYLRHTWMQALFTGSDRVRHGELFEPQRLFKSQDELAAYREHVQAW